MPRLDGSASSNVARPSDMAALRNRLGADRPDTGYLSGVPSGEGLARYSSKA
ncbi:hypothetical protein MCOR21_010331 [Pyricularia oryzae]|nr:hypothetical protein MCOR28_002443 [Pyricularia oryzae]KAI6386362.1 hypothetical protein MCOR32_000983 [Pyricularia oryzae]KAI6417740.1 hypothetical protein MCOR20_000231 [Pyricularia oryzae]KAI6419334.1 hypothetical protein MCOR21_010331 [Pyricularia oryzae]